MQPYTVFMIVFYMVEIEMILLLYMILKNVIKIIFFTKKWKNNIKGKRKRIKIIIGEMKIYVMVVVVKVIDFVFDVRQNILLNLFKNHLKYRNRIR